MEDAGGTTHVCPPSQVGDRFMKTFCSARVAEARDKKTKGGDDDEDRISSSETVPLVDVFPFSSSCCAIVEDVPAKIGSIDRSCYSYASSMLFRVIPRWSVSLFEFCASMLTPGLGRIAVLLVRSS